MYKRLGMACLLGSAVFFGGFVACGDDDEDDTTATATSVGTSTVTRTATTSPSSPTTTATRTATRTASATGTATGSGEQLSAYCEAITDAEILVNAGPDGEDQAALDAYLSDVESAMDAAADAAEDDDTRTAVENLRDVLLEGLPTQQDAVFGSPEFIEAADEVDTQTDAQCDFEQLSITSVDYEFEGVPDEVPEGIVSLELQNDGEEVHEALIFRANDEETPLDDLVTELLALGEEESASAVTFTGAAFAPPGESSDGIFRITEPGRYLVLCFVSEGTTDLETEGSGPPHAQLGMAAEFTVE
jgi:hypothetical protein